MTAIPTVKLAGYQGANSILTAELKILHAQLQTSGVDGSIDFLADVTAHNEKATQLFASVENNQSQIAYMASSYLSARVKELSVLDIAFSVEDRITVWSRIDGQAGEMIKQAVESQSGFKVLGFWDNGFRHISNSVRAIHHPDDCKGIVIRSLDSADYRAALNALGFNAVTTDVKDLVRVIESGEVQAQENPLTNLLNFDIWKHHPHVSLTHHYFGVLLLVCSQQWYSQLTPTQQQILESAVKIATKKQRQWAAEQDESAIKELVTHGVAIVEINHIDKAAMKRATHDVTQQLLKKLPPTLINAYLPDRL
ncbi:MAG: TRAP transporter substrate-binding protein [Limnohabitans sp.]|nr:TRAP transporter substrate-binding protein [Limnohabitans sp.]